MTTATEIADKIATEQSLDEDAGEDDRRQRVQADRRGSKKGRDEQLCFGKFSGQCDESRLSNCLYGIYIPGQT